MANFDISFAILLLSLLFSRAKSNTGLESTFSTAAAATTTTTSTSKSATILSPQSPPRQTLFSTPAPPPPTVSHDIDENFSHTDILAPILFHLGFNELATAVPALAAGSFSNAWSGPSTLFAPFDSSLRTCYSCSAPEILSEHIVPGLFTIDYLRNLAFGTKIETLSPGRCITVTFTATKNSTTSSKGAKVFIGGVEITHPDLFNNGLVVIHGIQGYIAPLSPFSCNVERLTSLSFPQQQDRVPHQIPHQPLIQPAIMRLMLRDAILRLRNNGFSVLSLAMKVKYAELVNLSNMTVFAIDDVSIFSGSHAYISSIRFHIVPNHFLTIADLEKLPVGATLPTLERGQSLMVTVAGGGGFAASPMRINYVRIKVPDVMRNLKIVVHSVYLPFPRIHPSAAAYDTVFGLGSDGGHQAAMEGSCSALMEEDGSCVGVPMPQVKPTMEIEDHYGL